MVPPLITFKLSDSRPFVVIEVNRCRSIFVENTHFVEDRDNVTGVEQWAVCREQCWMWWKYHRPKIPKFQLISWYEILFNHTVYAEFQVIRPKLCGNFTFQQNFNTSKLGEMMIFYAVHWGSHVYSKFLQISFEVEFSRSASFRQ